MKFIRCCFAAGLSLAVAGVTTPVADAAFVAGPSQDAKAEFEKKYAEVGGQDCKDANALYQVALWADQNNLKTDSKRLLRQVIKIDTDHAEARAKLGYEKFQGKWLTTREIAREKEKAEEAERAKLGLKKWKGEWVPAEDFANLEKGLVKVTTDGNVVKWVTVVEKERIEKGMTLYNGIWATKEDIEHLKKGEFKVGDKYLSEADADKVHSDFTNPWEVEGELCTLSTSCDYKFAREALTHADAAIRHAHRIIDVEIPKNHVKISLIMVKDLADYQQLGNQPGLDNNDATMSSNWNTFVFSDQNTGRCVGVSIYDVLDEKNKQGNDNFNLGHIRFAAAAAALRNVNLTEAPPVWFTIGVASYCERFWHPKDPTGVKKLAIWSLDAMNQEGGLLEMQPFCDEFAVTKQSILQAGLILSYLQHAQLGPKVGEQWKKCVASFKAEKQKGLEKDFVKLEIQLGKDGVKEIDAYCSMVRS